MPNSVSKGFDPVMRLVKSTATIAHKHESEFQVGLVFDQGSFRTILNK